MKIITLSWVLLSFVTMVLLGQAFRLQVIQGKTQARRAQQNRFRIRTLEASRGFFYDINGMALTGEEDGRRTYPFGEEFAHVLGYIGEANAEELNLFGVEMGRFVGKMGLERSEDGLLRGIEGGMVEEFSANGEKVRVFSKKEPIAGRSVQLTLDQKLQRTAYLTLKQENYRGAVVASTIDGKILAMASYPSFDPNAFTKLLAKDNDSEVNNYVEDLFKDERKPVFNRAIAGLYPPASTYKIVTSIAALENEVVTEKTLIEDTGEISAGGSTFSNWFYTERGGTDGMVDVAKALQRSNDIYYYKVGEKIGITQLAEWSRKFGLGSLTGISLTGEVSGLVPDRRWKKDMLGDDWYLGDTYITAIGQGKLQTTPLQVHMMTTAMANNGWLCTPTLVSAVIDEPSYNIDPTSSFDKNRCEQLPIKTKNLNSVKKGLMQACEPGGTGWPLFNFAVNNSRLNPDDIDYFRSASASADLVRIPVACKTGTAETGFYESNGSQKPKQKLHAWFVAFAPVINPEIVVTVLLEDAGQGSDKAAPIAREVLKTWFENR
jgi:penicillin-binding protein 2